MQCNELLETGLFDAKLATSIDNNSDMLSEADYVQELVPIKVVLRVISFKIDKAAEFV